MLSRVAESLYWMNRYIERAENTARFIDVNLNIGYDLPPDMHEQWEPLLQATGELELFKENYEGVSRENVIQFLTFDRNYESSIYSCLERARNNARSIREIISSEMWRQLNETYLFVTEAQRAWTKAINPDPAEFFGKVKSNCILFGGYMDSTYSHGEGWNFGTLGRQLERADQVTRLLDVKYFYLLPSVTHVGLNIDLLQWSAVLKSASAFEMYRKFHGQLDVKHIVAFLLLNGEFPRSVYFCVNVAEKSLDSILGNRNGSVTAVERELGRLRAELHFKQVEEVFQVGMHEFLDNLQQRIIATSAALGETFFVFQSQES